MASSLLLYTQNIARHAISWTPPQGPSSSGENSNTELLHAIHTSLHFALDPCTEHPQEPSSFTYSGGGGQLVVPAEKDLRLSKERDGEVTAKMFFFEPPSLRGAARGKAKEAVREGYVRQAMEALEKATGKPDVARFVVKLEGVRWDGKEVWEDIGMPEVDDIGPLWQYLSADPHIHSIGVSDFSAQHLSRLYSVLSSLPPKSVKSPVTDHLNLFDCDSPPCLNPPEDLLNVAARKGVELVAHSDDHQILPIKGLTGLLTEFQSRLPLPESFKLSRDAGQLNAAVAARWVLKYTVVIRSRQLLVDKGYIVSVEFPDAKCP